MPKGKVKRKVNIRQREDRRQGKPGATANTLAAISALAVGIATGDPNKGRRVQRKILRETRTQNAAKIAAKRKKARAAAKKKK